MIFAFSAIVLNLQAKRRNVGLAVYIVQFWLTAKASSLSVAEVVCMGMARKPRFDWGLLLIWAIASIMAMLVLYLTYSAAQIAHN